MQKLMGYMRAAVEKYNMIEDGDVIAVGVSGGKDSVALLTGLAEMRHYLPQKYDVVAITLDPCFGGTQADYSQIEELCRRLGVRYIIKRTNLWRIVFKTRQEKNPCSLCARMRRGCLHNAAIEAGCNKIALGHHMDDAAETFMMNLLKGGRIECFSPVTYLSRKNLYLIRPLIFARESEIISAVRRHGLPIVKSKCPVDGTTQRQNTKELLNSLDKDYGSLKEKIIGALQHGEVNGW